MSDDLNSTVFSALQALDTAQKAAFLFDTALALIDAGKYGNEVEKYLDVYLKTPDLPKSSVAKALLARANARTACGDRLLAQAQQDFQTVSQLDPYNRDAQAHLRRRTNMACQCHLTSPLQNFNMGPVGTLRAPPDHHKTKIIRAAAVLAGLEFRFIATSDVGVNNKSTQHLTKHLPGMTLSWESTNGFRLCEGTAIVRYLATLAPNSGLLGGSLEEAALIDQWTRAAEIGVDINSLSVNTPCDEQAETAYSECLEACFSTLESHLATSTFFVGEHITLADLSVADYVFRSVATTTFRRAKYPNLMRHLEMIISQPKLKAIYGDIIYAEDQAQSVPPTKEKPAAQQQQNSTQSKAEKKLGKTKKQKSTFKLENWKRTYSNKETRGPGGALEWFYQNFDSNEFSVWRVDYKHNEELTLTFMSSNQILGFFNRLERSRKYLFASIGVLGENNESVISGTLIIHGHEVEPVVEVAPDWGIYSYRRLDLGNEGDRKYFEAALAWDLELNGKKWAGGGSFSK